jgi:hypothetical protein
MRALKKEVIITDNSLSVTQRTAIYDHILTDDIIVANNDVGLISTEIEILRQGGNDATLMDLIVLSNTRTVTDTDKREDYAVVTNLHIVFDIDKGEYLTIVADLCFWTYLGLWGNFTCHN